MQYFTLIINPPQMNKSNTSWESNPQEGCNKTKFLSGQKNEAREIYCSEL